MALITDSQICFTFKDLCVSGQPTFLFLERLIIIKREQLKDSTRLIDSFKNWDKTLSNKLIIKYISALFFLIVNV